MMAIVADEAVAPIVEGVAELAQAIRAGRPERASGAQAYHVLDIMVSITESAQRGATVAVDSDFEKAPRQRLDPPAAGGGVLSMEAVAKTYGLDSLHVASALW
jgi:hypothetical protein